MAANDTRYPNSSFVEYLNTLHNVSANNQNAITELNITNPFFVETMVQRDVGNFIIDRLESSDSHIFILTGHAGDGKTGLLYQALRSWDSIDNGAEMKRSDTVTLPNGKKCLYIKDFSEFSADERVLCLEQAKRNCRSGISTFLVANTGPLINSFGTCFTEEAALSLVAAIDDNDGAPKLYDGIPVAVINVATIDNSTFVRPFLDRVLSESLWGDCAKCEKRELCSIYNNRCLMYHNSARVADFMTKHYVFQQEYGKKLTIRQIVAHIGFTITGGKQCRTVSSNKRAEFDYLFSNNFFGFKGVELNRSAVSMKAIGDVAAAAYDQKRMRADEALFINNELKTVFVKSVAELLESAGLLYHHSEQWQRAVKRAYMFLNIDTSESNWKAMLQDVFSPWYPRYLQLRAGESSTSGDKELVQDALQMLFTDSIVGREKEIPVTMKRDTGVTQSVQLVYDSLLKKKIKIEQEAISDFSQTKRYGIYMAINGDRINTLLSLPLFDYFEEIRRGAIATNIDPMLSQGIDSLKAQIIAFCECDKNEIELMTLSDNGWDTITAEYESGGWKVS